MITNSMQMPSMQGIETEGGVTGATGQDDDDENSVSMDAEAALYSKQRSTPGGVKAQGYAAPGINVDSIVMNELNREETEKSTDNGNANVHHKMSSINENMMPDLPAPPPPPID